MKGDTVQKVTVDGLKLLIPAARRKPQRQRPYAAFEARYRYAAEHDFAPQDD